MADTVAIIDYGLGNLGSVAGAIERLGFRATISSERGVLATASKLILPGVGAFGDGMTKLRERGLIEILDDLVRAKHRPILGICLGCQLFARKSFEFGEHAGLGWIDADVVPIEPGPASLRIPHVGWNELTAVRDSILLTALPNPAIAYYVHSFHVKFDDLAPVVAVTDYGGPIVAAYQLRNIYATQFHPEKSQQNGLTVLRNFLDRA
jgi:imidazole glycerol-phosphate synthase subunit HisH